ncbi:HPr kinase/phosphorylase [Aurantiacibacter spongiae]|uniref:Serine kinase n=1 Tax=Aurantiacibacter spongiae TaxID=2488860 RepID=A0A3N5D030_9SPHN|nr:HPr kinase/phosphatase C-terminal domain-containing protein [Aurantiacibacter spongiae]RPF72339.1 serine kinase [Aurantiacibacter spongiae]
MSAGLEAGLVANVTCVALERRGVLIRGAPGSGKSSLALALIDRGAILVGDDGVILSRVDGSVRASPPPRIAGHLEIRNVGIVRVPVSDALIAIVLDLVDSAPRLPDGADICEVAGVAIPRLALYPDAPALALRAEWALSRHGLA